MSKDEQTSDNSIFNRALICSVAGWTGAHEAYRGRVSIFLVRYALPLVLAPLSVELDNFIPLSILLTICAIEALVILHGSSRWRTIKLGKRCLVYFFSIANLVLALSIYLAGARSMFSAF